MAKPVAVISQAEYLKKYLTGKKGDKKRRKKKPVKAVTSEKRSVIVDDDEVKTMRPLDDSELDLFALTEDAPQIAGIIDERPDEVRTFENFRSSARWKVLADEDGIEDIKVVAVKDNEKSAESSDDDVSPLRRNQTNSDGSPTDKQNSDSENSHTSRDNRRGQENKSDSRHKQRYDSDESPTQNDKTHHSHKSNKNKYLVSEVSPHWKQRKDTSSSRSKRRDRQHEISLSRNRMSGSDEAPRHSNELNTTRLMKRETDEELPLSSKHDRRTFTKSSSNVSNSPPRRRIKKEPLSPLSRQNTESRRALPDISPPRRSKQRREDQNLEKSHNSRNCRDENVDSDETPPRRSIYDDDNTQRRGQEISKPPSRKRQLNQDDDSDESPPRRKDHDYKRKTQDNDSKNSKNLSRKYKLNKDDDSDESPPRRRNYDSFRKNSQENSQQLTRKCQRVQDVDSDESPPRKQKHKDKVSKHQWTEEKDARRKFDSDESPPRQPKRGEGESKYGSRDVQHLKKQSSRKPRDKSVDSVESPPRKCKERQNSDESPPRKHKKIQNDDKFLPGKSRLDENPRHSKAHSRHDSNGEIKSSKETLGGNAAPIMRDRKTGRIRNLEEEARQKAEDSKKTDVTKEKYSRWGKGLAQVAATEVRLNDALHEMSKPVARYADDNDLDKMLRAQDREGDPMLEYMKSKSISVAVANKPRYQGSWMPNRYNIPPGHRWDGVDRSSGYEKQWFENINSRRALEEDAYKWSVADM